MSRRIDSCSESPSRPSCAAAVGEVQKSVRSYVTDICALHRLMRNKLCLAFLCGYFIPSLISSTAKLSDLSIRIRISRGVAELFGSQRIDFTFRPRNISPACFMLRNFTRRAFYSRTGRDRKQSPTFGISFNSCPGERQK